ncbi:protein-tyrosine-phosphatase [Nonlabens tegetincola]|uniref:protein-tyrosine-phosphatase n=1 Tax=Nonlabens tegetincola TaxID=323273 RepID=UPI000A204114|nr:protein-tyrosine-phosphatase [Nonlabens tegetincola]ARN70350.1 protein-tyrosine-phosphatase [Nonlabens tegetincola]
MLFTEISDYLKNIQVNSIDEQRKETLQPLIDFIKDRVQADKDVRINFICTHNSRRSHLSQIWAQAAASYLGYNKVTTYSAGTEATALFPVVAQTLESQGFQIEKLSETDNPVYSIKYGENEHPIIGFSKVLNNNFNPQGEFAAVMTCDSANETCPFIAGAIKRIPITFLDPKISDGTPQQQDVYLERSHQIATEMLYVFQQAQK